MYVYMYIYTYIYIHTHTHTRTYMIYDIHVIYMSEHKSSADASPSDNVYVKGLPPGTHTHSHTHTHTRTHTHTHTLKRLCHRLLLTYSRSLLTYSTSLLTYDASPSRIAIHFFLKSSYCYIYFLIPYTFVLGWCCYVCVLMLCTCVLILLYMCAHTLVGHTLLYSILI